MCRLQGFALEDLGLDAMPRKPKDGAVAACVGNMMNIQILLRLLPRVLCLSKLISVEEYERIRNLPFPNAKINACFDC
jgi:hypothetical protein